MTIRFLESKRVFLRPIEEADLDLFYNQGLWDSEVRRLTGTQAFFNRKSVKQWFEKIGEDSNRIDLLICQQEDEKPIGDMAILEIDQLNRKALVRVSLFVKETWGGGLGTEALSLLIDYGFRQLNLNRIGLDVFSYNTRAIRSYEKLGFVKEGQIRDALYYDGVYHDSILMGLKEEEFVKHHN
ncbi:MULTISPECIES: GNAT family N-acetyltransferase [Pontibacillus]|uniref:GNAT family protein n=1 Tax=Pontibacillus chungwhensis TaxID=265426 RepID=A0ABY8UTC5_9BACI|nr:MULTISPECIES: GNAT family protein [Pontibacillus]MCD5323376.1 GNAT family N-acetyltransferase [Pontibacillus sp. HN14]WIF96757.1 GNAT family protein [Pontibacillus chungwhensis]